MKPRPMPASSSIRRLRQPLAKNFMSGWSVVMAEHGDHVIGGDDAGEAAVFVHNGERDEIVFVEQGGDLVLRRIRGAGDIRFAQLRKFDGWRRDRDLDERH